MSIYEDYRSEDYHTDEYETVEIIEEYEEFEDDIYDDSGLGIAEIVAAVLVVAIILAIVF